MDKFAGKVPCPSVHSETGRYQIVRASDGFDKVTSLPSAASAASTMCGALSLPRRTASVGCCDR